MQEKMGCLIADIKSTTLSQEEIELIAHPLIGGVILFSRNYHSREQLKNLCDSIRAVDPKKATLILADQEGGRVQRFIPEFSRLPSAAAIGALYDIHPNQALIFAKQCGLLMANELLSVGVDLSLAPVLDLKANCHSAIGDRAFHANEHTVTALAKAYIAGMKLAGMAAVVKHFPGHGHVSEDSHLKTPVDDRTLEAILQKDLKPFIDLFAEQVPALMSAHIIFKQIDDQPVTFSAIWLREIVRKRLKFSGLIFSDDLNMQGANRGVSYADRFLAARESGCDIILLCNNPSGIIQVLDEVQYEHHLIPDQDWQSLRGGFSTEEAAKHYTEAHLALQQFNKNQLLAEQK